MITYWYKDFWIKFMLILNWVLIIFLIHYLFFLYFQQWSVSWIYFIAIFIFGLSLWYIIRLVNWLHYKISDDGIKIILPSWKDYFLEFDNISKIEKFEKLPFWYWVWVKYSFFSGDVMFTTSLKNAYRIYMNDWRRIIITPRKDLLQMEQSYKTLMDVD